jgi:serine/threonine protein kinase
MSEGSLQDIIDKNRIPSEKDLAIVAYSILMALLDLTKKNIMHRDIKPGNILVSQSGAIKVIIITYIIDN